MKMTARTPSILAGAAAAALVLAACSGGDSAEAGGGDDGEFVPNFAFITGDISDFGQVQIEGMESVVEPLDGSITILDNGDNVDAMNQDCNDAVTSGQYNGILINSPSAPGAIPCVDTAHAAGIPVATVESVVGPDQNIPEPQVEGVILSAAVDNEALAEASSDMLEQACAEVDGTCNYIQTVGSQSYPLSIALIDAFEERFADNPEINQIALGEDGFNADQGRQTVADLLNANPEANLIITQSDSVSVQVANLLEEQGREDIVLLGDGLSRQGAEAIANGDMHSTIMLTPRTLGEVATQALVDHNLGEEVLSPEEVNELLAPVIVTEENVDEFEAQWG